jgi:WhiB family transcriptional regulator, redox-sensing transcriptional regulator
MAKSSAAQQISAAHQASALQQIKHPLEGPEPARYVPSAPENWFVDPVRLGVPGVRQPSTVGAAEEENPLAWQSDSLCAQTDPEAFFPEKGGSTRDAKKICASCEVRAQCLEYALENDERFGIWGGLSERERRKLRKRA